MKNKTKPAPKPIHSMTINVEVEGRETFPRVEFAEDGTRLDRCNLKRQGRAYHRPVWNFIK